MNMFRAFMELDQLNESVFDANQVKQSSWIAASGQSIKLPNTTTQTAANVAHINNASTSSNKFIVRIILHGGRLRALATDGVHPAAWVAFPNDLRQFEGQKYEVDQLIWNGKNYRVSGNIVEI